MTEHLTVLERLDVLAGKLELDRQGAEAAIVRMTMALLRGEPVERPRHELQDRIRELLDALEAQGRYVSANTCTMALGALLSVPMEGGPSRPLREDD